MASNIVVQMIQEYSLIVIVTLGHQRLSIIDLSSAGHQSFTYNHKIKKL